jgi:hypothetical protein
MTVTATVFAADRLVLDPAALSLHERARFRIECAIAIIPFVSSGWTWTDEQLAQRCYKFADAFLEARDAQKGTP